MFADSDLMKLKNQEALVSRWLLGKKKKKKDFFKKHRVENSWIHLLATKVKTVLSVTGAPANWEEMLRKSYVRYIFLLNTYCFLLDILNRGG